MPHHQDKLAIILGPTASGKTAVSVRVAQILGAEIISGDSMQVYRRMDIGTAKIRPPEMGGIPHHLINILEPDADYSVADFRQAAQALIREINARGRLPLVVGGTGLYVSSLVNPYLFPADTLKDEDFRHALQEELRQAGAAQRLHARLAKVDPAAAARIHPNDHHRLIRALEVYQVSGRPISQLQQQSQTLPGPDYRFVLCGLNCRRELLYARIEARVEQMLAEGLLDEVQALLEAGVPRSANAMQGLGYRQMVAYLDGACSLAEAVERLKRDTRRFAKRQYTWFKRDQRIHWFDIEADQNGNHYSQTENLAQNIAAWLKRELGEVPI